VTFLCIYERGVSVAQRPSSAAARRHFSMRARQRSDVFFGRPPAAEHFMGPRPLQQFVRRPGGTHAYGISYRFAAFHAESSVRRLTGVRRVNQIRALRTRLLTRANRPKPRFRR
jgi:hypothetical protein